MGRAPVVCGSIIAIWACRAWATSVSYPWDRLFYEQGTAYSSFLSVEEEQEATRIPVDAVPWSVEPCLDIDKDECVLRAGEQVIPVTVETTGREACGSLEDPTFDHTVNSFLRSYVPDEPLMTGQDYALECELNSTKFVFTRMSSAPSAPPGKLEVMGLERRSSGCGGEDYLEVRFNSLSGPFLEEGGYIEVLSPQGEVAALGPG